MGTLVTGGAGFIGSHLVAASKHAAELLCDTWHRLHGLPIITLRFFTVYGPRQRPDMALYRFLRAILENRPITLYGDGSSMRDYTYVQDTVRGILAAVDCPLPSAVFNLGNSKPVTLRELVETLARVLGRAPEIRWAPEQPGDVPLTWADTERAQSILGFECACSLQDGLARFVEWMQAEELAGDQGPR